MSVQQDIETFDAAAVNSKQARELYAARTKIHPKRATGRFRHLKWWIMFVTLGIYYVTPWLRWDRGAYAPDQAVLIDLANRRFYFFFIEIWPHEFFYVAGLLVMAGIGLFFVTSTVGRAWCGYTCPQTVWVDLFVVVERFFEGDRNARIKLDGAAMSASKIRKRIAKHATWILISIATGGAWIFYFAYAPTLIVDLFTLEAPFVAYATIAVLAFTTYVFGGLMREQVCTYMCPWPRIQAAMLDEHSLTVTYNDWRGEPRSRHAKKAKAEGQIVGDCVDCNACVAVCPMGIDIRDGQQLECITCALCIDACDTVMAKIGLDRGLISYATLNDYDQNMAMFAGPGSAPGSVALAEHWPEQANASHGSTAGFRSADGNLSKEVQHTDWRSFIRPRTFIYGILWSLIGLALVLVLLNRERLDVNVLRDRNPVFVVLSDGSIRIGYDVKILNMRPEPRTFRISLDGLSGAVMKQAGSETDATKVINVDVNADQLRSVKVFVRVPPEALADLEQSFTIVIDDVNGDDRAIYNAQFEVPK